jgi:hypothetical protein
MSSYYIVLEDINYDNNRIRFVTMTEELAIKWCLLNTKPEERQFSLIRYDISNDEIQSETEIAIPYPEEAIKAAFKSPVKVFKPPYNTQ